MLHGQKQFITPMVDESETIVRRTGHVQGCEFLKPTNAMFCMNNQVAGMKCSSLGDEVFWLDAPPAATLQTLAQHVLFRDHRDVRRSKPAFQRQHCCLDDCV